MTTQLDTDKRRRRPVTAAVGRVSRPPVSPSALFSREWFGGIALRYSMVIIMLLVIAYFSYRSARFGTVDNLVTILVAAAPFALIALGQTLVDPHRRYRPVGRQRDRGVGDGRARQRPRPTPDRSG